MKTLIHILFLPSLLILASCAKSPVQESWNRTDIPTSIEKLTITQESSGEISGSYSKRLTFDLNEDTVHYQATAFDDVVQVDIVQSDTPKECSISFALEPGHKRLLLDSMAQLKLQKSDYPMMDCGYEGLIVEYEGGKELEILPYANSCGSEFLYIDDGKDQLAQALETVLADDAMAECQHMSDLGFDSFFYREVSAH